MAYLEGRRARCLCAGRIPKRVDSVLGNPMVDEGQRRSFADLLAAYVDQQEVLDQVLSFVHNYPSVRYCRGLQTASVFLGLGLGLACPVASSRGGLGRGAGHGDGRNASL